MKRRVYGASPVKRYRRTDAQLDIVDAAIIAAIEEDKPVTLRGIYYRVVSAGAVPKTEAGYGLVSRQLLKLRRNGTVAYGDIVDGTRSITRWRVFDKVDDALAQTAATYRRALWHEQDSEVMIITEKDAITGVIEDVCAEWQVPYVVVRGYASETIAWQVASAVSRADDYGHTVFLYQLGDHDPSGVDAWRAFEARVTAFCESWDADPPEFERLAVTPEQISAWNLPTRPTKLSDTRAAGFAGESVEVDAIRAGVLRQIVRDAIEQHIDEESLRQTRYVEDQEREFLRRIIPEAS